MRYDVLTSGYVSLDRIIKVDSPLRVGFTSLVQNSDNAQVYYGGCSTNIAYLLARLGLETLPIVRFGQDYEENGFVEFLRQGGVCLDAVEIVPGETTSNCYLISDPNHDHVTIFYPGAMDKKYAKPMPDQFFQAARLGVLTVGSYQDNLEFFNKCKKHDLSLVFGMKCDFDAFPKEFFTEVIHYSRIIFTNRMEREEIEKRLGLRSIADLLDRGRAEVIVTTLGAQGSVCYHKSHGELVVNEVEAANFGPVVDTTGSGDAFIAGFLYGYLTGKPVQECGELGSVLASFVIEQPGSCSNAPSEAEFQQRYAQFISRRTAEDD